MVDLSEADKRAIFGADYKTKRPGDDQTRAAEDAARSRRKLAESLTSSGWLIAFFALAYASGVFFTVFGPYDSGMMYGSLAVALAGAVVAIAGGQYGKKA